MRSAYPDSPATSSSEIDEGLRAHMISVYNYMAGGVALTGITAYAVANTPSLAELFLQGPLYYVAMFSPLAFILILGFGLFHMSAAAVQILFWAFCAVMGLSMAAIFAIFTDASLTKTFFAASAMFGFMSLWGYTTKADLTRISSFLIMGLVGILIASLINFFLQSPALHFAVSVIGVLVFLGMTAWDTQEIKEQYHEGLSRSDRTKLAVSGALSLYLNFINLFQFLLSFLGERE